MPGSPAIITTRRSPAAAAFHSARNWSSATSRPANGHSPSSGASATRERRGQRGRGRCPRDVGRTDRFRNALELERAQGSELVPAPTARQEAHHLAHQDLARCGRRGQPRTLDHRHAEPVVTLAGGVAG